MSNRALAALIVIVVLLVLGGLLYRAYFMDEAVEPGVLAPTEEKSEQRRPRVKVVVTACRRVYGRTEMEGYVENTGSVDLRFITVQSVWKDANGVIIDTDVIYVVNEEILKPGERKSFHDVTRRSAAEKCNARPLDWWS